MFDSLVRRCSTFRGARRDRRGKIIVMTAILMVVLLGMIAFSVDVGYMAVTRTEMQICTDAAALAGAAELVNGVDAARAEALEYLAMNKVGGSTLGVSNASIDFGTWDDTTRAFTVSGNTPNGIRINTTLNNTPLFFGKALNKDSFNTSAQSIAIYQPRDISLVLDYSGSMAYDSQFRNMSLLGKPAIETNLQQIWQQMGSPTYGSLAFTPVLYGTQSSSNSSVKAHFSLNSLAYPWPDGSWDEYVDYVQNSSYLNSAGYRCKYGMMTLVHYQMESHGSFADSPFFHQTSEQPVTALKDAVDAFLAYLDDNSTDDRVSLSIYTYSDGTAVLEHALTKNYAQVSTTVRGRQAGHYIGGTNISAGMNKGRMDLQNNARVGVSKLMILMTDGVVNLPSGNTTNDKQAVRNEAIAAAAAKIPIVTISVGALADTDLMQEVADITGGAAFIVPGGQPISAVEDQLEAVFAQVAADRPLKLVQ